MGIFKSKPTLQRLEATLRQADLAARYVEADAEMPLDRLLVPFEVAAVQRTLTLELTFASDAYDAMPATDKEAGGGYDRVDYLHLYVGLPFEVAEAKVCETALHVLRLNRDLPLVGFGLKMPERALYFRAMLPCKGRQDIAPVVVQEAVETVIFLMQRFAAPLQATAAG
jgi:hypothetical protein